MKRMNKDEIEMTRKILLQKVEERYKNIDEILFDKIFDKVISRTDFYHPQEEVQRLYNYFDDRKRYFGILSSMLISIINFDKILEKSCPVLVQLIKDYINYLNLQIYNLESLYNTFLKQKNEELEWENVYLIAQKQNKLENGIGKLVGLVKDLNEFFV